MAKEPSCQNCHSPRRSIRAQGLCSPCFTWQRRLNNFSAKLERVRNDPGKYFTKYDPKTLFGNIRTAKRVLEELRWREEGLLSSATDSEYLEGLICILTSVCRSEMAFLTHSLVEQMEAKSRCKIYEVLLAIVENIPSREPKLHFNQYLKKGAYGNGDEGWWAWISECRVSSERLEESREIEVLKRAYLKYSQAKIK